MLVGGQESNGELFPLTLLPAFLAESARIASTRSLDEPKHSKCKSGQCTDRGPDGSL